MPNPSQNLAPGTIIADRYRIEEQIGAGGFGAVFRATQLNLGRLVALKVLLPELLENDGLYRFQREAELAQRLAHPNTVRLLDFGRAADSSPFLVFELLKGQTLEAVIHGTRGLSIVRVARVATQILKALMEAHGLGIVHRDIKPANVFLSDFDGEPDFVKILDFGIASGAGLRAITKRGEVVGTPRYMAPEQVRGEEPRFATDLYALGLLMSEAITGRPVFEGMAAVDIAREQISDNPVPHAPEVMQSPLGPIIHRATQKLPERRFASAAEMLAQLEAALPLTRSSNATPGWSPSLGGAQTGALGGPTGMLSGPTGMLGGPTGVAHGYYPIATPGPAVRRGPKTSGPPWVLLGALGGGVILIAAALAIVLLFVRPGAHSSSASVSSAIPSGGAPDLIFNGGSEGPVEALVNADAVPDFVAFVADSADSPYRTCAFDGTTFRSLWCAPMRAERSAPRKMFMAAAGRSFVVVDAGAVVHILDLGTGAERGTLKLASHATHICKAVELPGKFWVRTEDKKGFTIDPIALALAPGARPASCTKTKDECDVFGLESDPTCPKDLEGPRLPSLYILEVKRDGADAVGIGYRPPSGSFHMIAGLGPGKGGSSPVRWQHPIVPGDGLAGSATGSDFALAGGRAVTSYNDLAAAKHIIAVDAATGRTVWDVITEDYYVLNMSPTRVFVDRFKGLDVRDAATGKLLGGIGHRP